MDLKTTIVRIFEVPNLNGTTVVNHTHVQFTVGTHGPFTLEFAPPNNTAEFIREAVENKAAEIRLVVGEQG